MTWKYLIQYWILILVAAVLFSGEPNLLEVVKAVIFSNMQPPCEWPTWPVK